MELEFCSEPSSALLCPICQDLLSNPLITPSCSHSFCSACIQQALQRDSSVCPLCRKPVQLHQLHPNLALKQLIEDLRIWCPNHGRGCPAQLTRDQVQRHLEEHCDYKDEQCPYQRFGCGFSGSRGDLKVHLHECTYEKLKIFLVEQYESSIAAIHDKLTVLSTTC